MFPHLSNSIKTYFRKIDQFGNNRISYSYKYRWFINSPFTYWWVLCRIQSLIFQWIFILLFLAWSIFLKTVFMDLGGVGNNRVSYLLNYQCFPDFFHILRGFVPYIIWDALYTTCKSIQFVCTLPSKIINPKLIQCT